MTFHVNFRRRFHARPFRVVYVRIVGVGGVKIAGPEGSLQRRIGQQCCVSRVQLP